MESCSAVTRVLTIPELLEKVLVQVGLERPNNADQDPAINLFPIQRVDRNFKAVISSSPTLQGLMCLDLTTLNNTTSISAIAWLLRHRGWTLTITPPQATADTPKIVAKRTGSFLRFYRVGMARRSWRGMKVPAMVVELEVYDWGMTQKQTIQIEEESTLGRVERELYEVM